VVTLQRSGRNGHPDVPECLRHCKTFVFDTNSSKECFEDVTFFVCKFSEDVQACRKRSIIDSCIRVSERIRFVRYSVAGPWHSNALLSTIEERRLASSSLVDVFVCVYVYSERGWTKKNSSTVAFFNFERALPPFAWPYP